MPEYPLIAQAAPTTVTIVRNVKADQLDAATPCRDWDVRKLVNHLLFWGPSLEAAAGKEFLAPPADSEEEVSLTGGDWASELEAQIDRLAIAWGRPGAWDGMTRLGSPMELPASMIGAMALGELVVHGWDLARGTGQRPTWDDEVLEFLDVELAKTAEQGREMGVYGAAVAVPDTAPALARILGLTGRDPNWTP